MSGIGPFRMGASRFLGPIFAVALVFTAAGFLPGQVLLPLDLLADLGAWKADPSIRIPVSNRLLSDVVLQFYPWDLEVRRHLSGGELPWVNRWAGDGSPLWANPQTALLSPFTWPRLLLGARGWAWTALLKLLFAGWGAWWLARTAGASRFASMISGLIFMMSGFSVVWGLHPHTNVFAVLPWLAAAAWEALRRPDRVRLTKVALFSALATAGGHPESLAVGVVGISAFLAWELRASRCPGDGLSALRVVAASASGFLLLGVLLVPFFHVLAESHTIGFRGTISARGSIAAPIVSQILPGVLGSPLRGELDLTAAFPLAGNFAIRSAPFIGAITLLLIALGWSRLSSSLRRGVIVGVVGLVISWRLPGLSWVVKEFPATSFIAQQYFALLFVLFGSLAAGEALMRVAEGRHRWSGRWIALAGTLLVLLGLLPVMPASRQALVSVARNGIDHLRSRGALPHEAGIYEARLERYLEQGQRTAIRRLALPGACWLLAGIALTGRWRRRDLLAGAVVAELAAFGFGWLPAVRIEEVPGIPEVVRVVQHLDPQRRWMVAAPNEIYPPNLGTLHRIRQIAAYDVLTGRDRMERLERAGIDPRFDSVPSVPTAEQLEALAALGVRFGFAQEELPGARVGGHPPPGVGVYQIADAVPQPRPENLPPAGLAGGAAASLVGLVLLLVVLVPARSDGNGVETGRVDSGSAPE